VNEYLSESRKRLCLLMLVPLLSASAKADTIVLDDFSLNLTAANLTFSALDGSGSTSTNNTTPPNRIQLAPNYKATWTDGTSGAQNGILGGVRSGEIRNSSGTGNSILRISAGTLGVDSPQYNMLCLACLTYNVSPQDFSSIAQMIVNFTAFAPQYRGLAEVSVSLSDGTRTASGLFSTNTAVVGNNSYWLTGLTNWYQLDKTNIRQVVVGFNATSNAVDFNVNSISFTHAPEPNSFACLVALLGIAATLRLLKSRHRRVVKTATLPQTPGISKPCLTA
jgi:hypothetical protein